MDERTELIEDLKEQIRFLKEIGVDSLSADLPAYEPEPDHELAHADFQTYVPTEEDLAVSKPASPAGRKESPRSPRRSDILSSVRLSDREIRDTANETLERSEEKPAEPVRIATHMEDASEGLFGDLSKGLPESDETLGDIRQDIGPDCTRCKLCETRTQVVNSVGNPNADLMFIGEAPGADEDVQGEPFVGRAGRLLTKIIEAIDLKREDVFIGNINRCRPPDNRRPMADEASVCKPFLLREIAVVRPKVIVVLGNTACQNLLETNTGITRLRGKFLDYFGIKVMPTFHPAYLLRDPRKKREVWEDLKLVREVLNDSAE
ncbi:MAG TPA: uracil-DNA glycosylase [Aridibacter sp.]|nr:uracil-DNA glycosylase [Aridibacter sp.]